MFSIIVNCSQAQNLVTNWALGIGGNSYDIGISNCLDNDNNVYTLGVFSEELFLDGGNIHLTSQGLTDYFIIKKNQNGNILWAKSFGGPNYDGAGGVAVIEFDVIPRYAQLNVDSNQNIYIVGQADNLCDLDPGNNEYLINEDNTGFLLKLDSEGNFLYANTYDCGFSDFKLNQNTIVIAGYFTDSLSLDSQSNSSFFYNYNNDDIDNPDLFILKLDLNGQFLSAKQIKTTSSLSSIKMAIDSLSENLYLCGTVSGLVFLDTSNVSNIIDIEEGYSCFIAKLSYETLTPIWVKIFGNTIASGSFIPRCNSILVSSDSKVYIGGSYRDSLSFTMDEDNINLISNGFYDIYVFEINSLTGEIINYKTFGGEEFDYMSKIGMKDNKLYVLTSYRGSFLLPNSSNIDIVIPINGIINSLFTIWNPDLSLQDYFYIGDSYMFVGATFEIDDEERINLCGNYTGLPICSFDNQNILAVHQGLGDCISIQIEYDIIQNYFAVKRNEIPIYPNPFHESFNISNINLKGNEISIIDIYGKKCNFSINSFSINNTKLTIEGSSGIYFLIIKFKDETKYYKLIKE